MKNEIVLILLGTAVGLLANPLHAAESARKISAEDALIMSSESFLVAHPDVKWRRLAQEELKKGRPDYAFNSFVRASRYADKTSQAMVAEMYLLGMGVDKDEELAYVWMDLAAERGWRWLVIKRERIWEGLTPEQQQSAIARGAEVFATYADSVAKRRFENVLKREAGRMTGPRSGADGSAMIVSMYDGIAGGSVSQESADGNLGGGGTSVRGDVYYEAKFWDPEEYWAWQDQVFGLEQPGEGQVNAGKRAEQKENDKK